MTDACYFLEFIYKLVNYCIHRTLFWDFSDLLNYPVSSTDLISEFLTEFGYLYELEAINSKHLI